MERSHGALHGALARPPVDATLEAGDPVAGRRGQLVEHGAALEAVVAAALRWCSIDME